MGTPSFAKVLVDVWAGSKLKRELNVVIPSLHGDPDESVKALVEYLWKPSICVHCEVFGHQSSKCTMAKMETKSKPKPLGYGFYMYSLVTALPYISRQLTCVTFTK